jgi:hypothetical protein
MNENELRAEFERQHGASIFTHLADGRYMIRSVQLSWKRFQRAAEWADARARRECAELCRETRNWNDDSGHDDGCLDCSDAIKATVNE